jgi:hypothetical protein
VHATEAGAVDDFLIDVPPELTEEDILEAVRKGRGRDAWVGRTDARGLFDEPTRVLGLATRVVTDPDELGPAIASLLPDVTVTWRPGSCAKEGFTADTMQLADPSGGTLMVQRPAPAFTPAEYARAHALTRLAGEGLRLKAVPHPRLGP